MYWLMKSEPDVFSIKNLKQQKHSGWEGVRNYQARNYMRDEMQLGHLAFFYHSNAKPPGIAGIMRVRKTSHPDPTQLDKNSEYYDPSATKEKPRWFMVDVEFVEEFSALITLEQLKKESALKNMRLLQKGSRLSVMPVEEDHWNFILSMRKQRT